MDRTTTIAELRAAYEARRDAVAMWRSARLREVSAEILERTR